MKKSNKITCMLLIVLLSFAGCFSAKEENGMHIILKVDIEDILRSLAGPHYSNDSIFNMAIAESKLKLKDSKSDQIDLFAASFEELNPGGQLAPYFMTPDSREEINFNTANAAVVDYLKTEVADDLEYTVIILENRLNRLGVSPRNRKLIRLSNGIDVTILTKHGNPEKDKIDRIINLLTSQAKLEFWTTYQNKEIWSAILEANRFISVMQEVSDDTCSDESAQFIRDNPLFAVMSPYTYSGGQLIPSAIAGVAELKDTAKVNTMLAIPEVKQLFPSDLVFAWHFQTIGEETPYLYLYALKASRKGRPAIGNRHYVTDVYTTTSDPNKEAFEVTLNMNAEGAKSWANLTRENIQKALAIVVDGEVYSAPMIYEEIKDGTFPISENLTQDEAIDLAIILNSGEMPIKLYAEYVELLGSDESSTP
ncbi:MAG TPA: hypothetical protein VJ951_16340 [Bacteroidales bacterium]|nr:hypothetical protein [Bacteroidales bacterium]